MEIKIQNSKFQKFGNFSVARLPQKGFVAQTWSWVSSLIGDAKYRDYVPKRVGLTPKLGKAELGSTALANRGAYLLLSQYNYRRKCKSEIQKFKNSGTTPVPPTSPEWACRPDMAMDAISYKRFEVAGLRPPKIEIYPTREQ